VTDGFRLFAGRLDLPAQRALRDEVLARVAVSPLYTPEMPRTGKPMSVRMTNFGTLGWLTDRTRGYRYQDRHPATGDPWPAIPDMLLDLWNEVTDSAPPPEACLVNYYGPGAKMGLHVDADEISDAPVVSVSLGDRALFRIGGAARNDRTTSVWLSSGDVCMFGGPARRAYHGVDRTIPGSSTLLSEAFPEGGRINLTLRRVNA
jgi:alkylated DNA repair protein (DNA oxidative demethylase)